MMRAFPVMWMATMAVGVCMAQKAASVPEKVPAAPAPDAQEQRFQYKRYEVTFRVPAGWGLTRKDGDFSMFHMDARSAPAGTMLRGAATINFNPYPTSTLSGAMFYYSVEPHATDSECAQQASPREPTGRQESRQQQDIAGMLFAHGHDEYGDICVEQRDEIYTAYRKGSCYRFDLLLTTFCSVSSGVRDMNRDEMREVEDKLAGILSSVELGWEKSGPHPVPAPEMQMPGPQHKTLPAPGPGPKIAAKGGS
jgi:hypothetical protein